MVCWNHYAQYKFAFIEKNLLIASTIDGVTRFRPPIGPHNPTLLASLLRLSADVSDDEPVVLIDEETGQWMKDTCPGIHLVPDRDSFEYVYLSRDLADLPGKTYLTIRHQVNKFRRNCGPSVELLSMDNRAEVKRFLIEWCEWKGCEDDSVLGHEKEATFYALEHFRELFLSGIIIRVNGKVGAISMFERLNDDTALVHFEKGLPDCEGIYKAINAETASVLAKDYIYINRESDMGIAGLREAKMRYHPHHMVEVLSLKRTS
jgi:hypothetical protein